MASCQSSSDASVGKALHPVLVTNEQAVMKYGVRYTDFSWWVYEVAVNELVSRHEFEFIARRYARLLNERGV